MITIRRVAATGLTLAALGCLAVPAQAAPAPKTAPPLKSITQGVPDELLLGGTHAVNLPSAVADALYVISCQPTTTRPAWRVADPYVDGDRAAGQIPEIDTSAVGWPVSVVAVLGGRVTGDSGCVADVNELPESWGAFGDPGDGRNLRAAGATGSAILPGQASTPRPATAISPAIASPSVSNPSDNPCNPSGGLGACIQVVVPGASGAASASPDSTTAIAPAESTGRLASAQRGSDGGGIGAWAWLCALFATFCAGLALLVAYRSKAGAFSRAAATFLVPAAGFSALLSAANADGGSGLALAIALGLAAGYATCENVSISKTHNLVHGRALLVDAAEAARTHCRPVWISTVVGVVVGYGFDSQVFSNAFTTGLIIGVGFGLGLALRRQLDEKSANRQKLARGLAGWFGRVSAEKVLEDIDFEVRKDGAVVVVPPPGSMGKRRDYSAALANYLPEFEMDLDRSDNDQWLLVPISEGERARRAKAEATGGLLGGVQPAATTSSVEPQTTGAPVGVVLTKDPTLDFSETFADWDES